MYSHLLEKLNRLNAAVTIQGVHLLAISKKSDVDFIDILNCIEANEMVEIFKMKQPGKTLATTIEELEKELSEKLVTDVLLHRGLDGWLVRCYVYPHTNFKFSTTGEIIGLEATQFSAGRLVFAYGSTIDAAFDNLTNPVRKEINRQAEDWKIKERAKQYDLEQEKLNRAPVHNPEKFHLAASPNE